MKRMIIIGIVLTLIIGCAADADGPGAGPDCPECSPCPTCPSCPEVIPCPTCPECETCPTPKEPDPIPQPIYDYEVTTSIEAGEYNGQSVYWVCLNLTNTGDITSEYTLLLMVPEMVDYFYEGTLIKSYAERVSVEPEKSKEICCPAYVYPESWTYEVKEWK